MTADELLARITSVVQSDWTGDYFCRVEGRKDTKDTLILYAGDPDDADLFIAVSKMVATWPCKVNEAQSYREYRRTRW